MIGRRTLCFLTLQNGNKNFSPSAELLGQTRKQFSLKNNYPPNGIVRSEFPPAPLQTIPIHESLQDFIWHHSIEQPGRPAFISAECPDDRLTFGEFLLQCHSVAAFLHKIGFSKGDVAGVVVPNCWQFLAAFMGAAMQGGCITGANAMLTELELARQFDEPKCRVVFCADFMLDKMLQVQKNSPEMKYLVLIPSQVPVTPLANLPPNVLNWTEIVETRPNFAKLLTPLQFDIDRDLAYLPFSSGTTGPGKGVMLTHKNVGTMLNIFNRHFDERIVCRMNPNWKWHNEHSLLILPLYHIYGFILGLNSLRSGGTGIMLKKFDLKLFCKTIQDYKIKYATLVPPLLVALAKNAAAIQRYDLSSLRFVMTGAAPAGEDICDEMKRAIPSVEQIAQGYGMTEQSLASHLPVFGMENQKAAGRLNANFEMKIVDVERRTPMPFGEVGEICTRSPTTMLGYLDRPDATAETVDEEGWLKTGDIGYQDEKGWTYVVDRLKELIKVKGLQVAPAELEDHLLSHPDIKDCAVIGVADEKCGEVPKAFVVKASEKLNENEVKEFIKGKVAPFKQLKFVEFIDEIPKSPSGKILRRILRNNQNNDVQQK